MLKQRRGGVILKKDTFLLMTCRSCQATVDNCRFLVKRMQWHEVNQFYINQSKPITKPKKSARMVQLHNLPGPRVTWYNDKV